MELSGMWKVLDSIPDKKRGREGEKKEEKVERKKKMFVSLYTVSICHSIIENELKMHTLPIFTTVSCASPRPILW